MTLLEAFRRLSPDCAADDYAAQDAITRVQDEIDRLARRLTFSEGIREEAAVATLVHMLYAGSRTTGALECDSDKRVRGFLRRSLYRKAIDLWRKDPTRGEDTIDDPEWSFVPIDEEPLVEDALTETDLHAEAERIFDRFQHVVVAGCAAAFTSAQARADFLVSVQRMEQLAHKAVTFEAVTLEVTGRTGATAESAVHKRHQRARDRLVDFILAEADAGRITADEARHYRGCVSFLHRRASSAKEAARAAQREQR